MSKQQTPAEVRSYVLAASAESLLHDLEGLLMGAYNLYDVGRAIPHPYDALGGMANGYLHDLKATAYKIQRYVKLVKAEETLTAKLREFLTPISDMTNPDGRGRYAETTTEGAQIEAKSDLATQILEILDGAS